MRWVEGDDSSLDIGDLCKVILSLPRVHNLSLSFNRFNSRPTAFPYEHAKASFAQIRHLSLHSQLRLNGRQNNVQPISEFLTMFDLDTLDMDSAGDMSVPPLVDPYRVSYFPLPSRPVQTRHVNFLSGSAASGEADILARILGPVNALRSVAYHLRSREDVHALGRLLHKAGRSVCDISLYGDHQTLSKSCRQSLL